MSEQNFRVQFLRGNTSENDAYTGREGEFTVDTEALTLRLHDGTTQGGKALATLDEVNNLIGGSTGSVDSVDVKVVSWAGDNITVPAGVTTSKEHDNSSLRIVHNKGKFPKSWFAFNREASPMTGITPTPLRNIQIVNDNEVIITSIGSFEVMDISIIF